MTIVIFVKLFRQRFQAKCHISTALMAKLLATVFSSFIIFSSFGSQLTSATFGLLVYRVDKLTHSILIASIHCRKPLVFFYRNEVQRNEKKRVAYGYKNATINCLLELFISIDYTDFVFALYGQLQHRMTGLQYCVSVQR